MLYANGLYQQDYYHQSCNEKIHICPVIMIHQISRYQVGQLDASQDDDVKPGKENGKIPFGRNPQLNVGHTFKGSLYIHINISSRINAIPPIIWFNAPK